MKNLFIIVLFPAIIQGQIQFENYFENKTLRFDYFHTGNQKIEYFSFDEMILEGDWAGSRSKLIDDFFFGKYFFKIFDQEKDILIYSGGYSSLFGEWQTTMEAKTTDRTFSETLIMPLPKKPVRLEILSRDTLNEFQVRFVYSIDPEDYFIVKDKRYSFPNFSVLESGKSSEKLDLVFLPEGYTASELDKFKEDCEKFSDFLLNYEPFKTYKDNINFWGIEAFSTDEGSDIPGENIWKNTILSSRYYTFDSERYLMTYDNKSVRDLASNAPYEQIIILVNSEKYGGGGIYNHYLTCAANNQFSEKIFIHEFGHSFGGLADEYYTSDVAYSNFYPLNLEPWEPNITTLVDFKRKWVDLIVEDSLIPTPSKPESYYNDKNKYQIGVFEGGGYAEKGVYRPSYESIMKSLQCDSFNKVSIQIMEELIQFYSE